LHKSCIDPESVAGAPGTALIDLDFEQKRFVDIEIASKSTYPASFNPKDRMRLWHIA
jgi:hypothetical protein